MQLFKHKERLILFFTATLLFLFYSYKIGSLMPFYGDIAWFYISAKDFLQGSGFPLVGITSSHIWLHQGPLWTYLLSFSLWLGNYDPLAGGYLSIIIGIVTVYFVYLFGKIVFSVRVGVISATLYATSPLITLNARTPYHTTLIPLVTLLYFLSLYMWMNGSKKYFCYIPLLLTVLYNFELATVTLVIPFMLIIFYGLFKKKNFIKSIERVDVIKAITLGMLPMVPVIIYDFGHGFKQTIIFTGWIFFTFFKGFYNLFIGNSAHIQDSSVLEFIYNSFRTLIFYRSGVIALSIVVITLLLTIKELFVYQKLRTFQAHLLILLWFLLCVGVFILNGVASDAYLLQIFPAVFIIIALGLNFIYSNFTKLAVSLIALIVLFNVKSTLNHNFFMGINENITLESRENVTRNIISNSLSQRFILKGDGDGSQFRSFTMPYEYLLWYRGHPVNSSAKQTFLIKEDRGEIYLSKE